MISSKLLLRGNTNTKIYRNYSATKKSVLRRIWESWVPIPTGVGLTLLAILQWRRLERRRSEGNFDYGTDQWEVSIYKRLPLRSLSRGAGKIAELPVPEILRPTLYSSFSKIFGVNINEMAKGLNSYQTFGDFFTRELKEGVRPLDDSAIISPADGRVLTCCKVNSFQIEQVKGVTYSIQKFLGNITWKKDSLQAQEISWNQGDIDWELYKKEILSDPSNELYQCVIYLAPGDYHRFHSPVDFQVNFRRHFSGELMSVSPRMAKLLPGLFAINERVVYTGKWKYGFFAFIPVGATNVGSIRVYDDADLNTNERKYNGPEDKFIDINWSKGQEIGEFRIGSTIVLLFEAPKDFLLDSAGSSKILVGNRLSLNY